MHMQDENMINWAYHTRSARMHMQDENMINWA